MAAGPVTHAYDVRGLRLVYHTWGSRERPPLVLMHGLQDHAKSFARLAALIADRYFLVAPDFRGHGESGWIGAGGDYHFYDYFYDSMAMVEHAKLDRFALVGHSMGGGVGTGLASLLKGRVSSMILLEGTGPMTNDLAETVSRLSDWAEGLARVRGDAGARRRSRQPMRDLDEAASRIRRYNERVSVEHAREMAATFTEPADDGQPGIVWRFDPLHRIPASKPYVLEEVLPMWRTLDMPILCLFGDETPWVPDDLPTRLAALRDHRVVSVEGAAHNIHHDRPEVLAQAIDWWLTGDRRGPVPIGLREGLPRALQ
jgi:pimeloyl-ACP methyl ester carboxylesterase